MKNLAELNKMRDKMRPTIHLREEKDSRIRVVVRMGTCGIAAGARPVLNAFVEEANRLAIDDVMIVQSGCGGECQFEPVVEILERGREKVTYVKMDAEKAKRVVREHLADGKVAEDLTAGKA